MEQRETILSRRVVKLKDSPAVKIKIAIQTDYFILFEVNKKTESCPYKCVHDKQTHTHIYTHAESFTKPKRYYYISHEYTHHQLQLYINVFPFFSAELFSRSIRLHFVLSWFYVSLRMRTYMIYHTVCAVLKMGSWRLPFQLQGLSRVSADWVLEDIMKIYLFVSLCLSFSDAIPTISVEGFVGDMLSFG